MTFCCIATLYAYCLHDYLPVLKSIFHSLPTKYAHTPDPGTSLGLSRVWAKFAYSLLMVYM